MPLTKPIVNARYVNDVIEYCEGAYISQDKNEISDATKKYLADALEAVATNIHCASANLTKFMMLQVS